MADKNWRLWDQKNGEYIDLLVHDNGDGTFSLTTEQTVNVDVDVVDITSFPAANLDTVEHGLITVDAALHRLNAAEMFYSEYSASVNDEASLDILITTGVDEVHLTCTAGAGGLSLFYLYETPTATNGTTVAVYNMNRRSVASAHTTVKHTPDVSSPGSTSLVNGRIVAGGVSPSWRWVLAPSTKYLLRGTNDSGSAAVLSVALEFYEEAV